MPARDLTPKRVQTGVGLTILALQLQSMLISESLGHHDSEIMDGSWIGRGDAGAVGVVVAGRQGANPAAVPAGTDGAIRGVVPGRSARARAAQDGLDAGGSGGGSRSLAPAGPSGPSDADALRDVVRDYVVETLCEPDAVLVLDETGFLKQGKA